MTRRENRVHPAATLLALLLWAAGTHAASAADPQAPYFVDVAAAAGMSHAYTGDWTHYVGGGVAAFDCDLDGDPDLFFAGGASPSTLYRNDSAPGTLRFSAVVGSALVETGVTGAYPLDIDGDGNMDLAALRLGANRLYRGLGECRFADAGEAWGVPGGDAWTTAFSAVWEGDNRLPTLAFGNYVDRDLWAAMHTPFGDSGTGAAPTPACPDNVLFRPADVDAATYAPAIGLSPGHCPLSMLFSDWSRAGRPDLRVSNDRFYHEDTGEEQLWHMGTQPSLYGRADGWPRLRIWGMGIASHDLTGDGLPDYFLSNMGANRLRTLAPGSIAGPEFREIAFDHGVEARRPHAGRDERPSTAWHSQFADVNNDGWIDLFVAKGNVEEMEEAAADDPNNLLLGGARRAFPRGLRGGGHGQYAAEPGRRRDRPRPGRPARHRCREPRGQCRDPAQPEPPRRPLDSGHVAAGRRQPERHRRMDRGARRGPHPAPRGRGRRRPCERASRMDSLRTGRGRGRRDSCPVARWELEPVAAQCHRSLPADRARTYTGWRTPDWVTTWTTGSRART